jgi:hypothetical protein
MMNIVLRLYAVNIAAFMRRTVCAAFKATSHLAMVGPNTTHTRNIVTRSDNTLRVMSQFFLSLLSPKVFHGVRANQGLLGVPFFGVGISTQIVDEM